MYIYNIELETSLGITGIYLFAKLIGAVNY